MVKIINFFSCFNFFNLSDIIVIDFYSNCEGVFFDDQKQSKFSCFKYFENCRT
jgi:hypothetical protein